MIVVALAAVVALSIPVAEHRWGAGECSPAVVAQRVELLTYRELARRRRAERVAAGDPAPPFGDGAAGDANPDLCRIRLAYDAVHTRLDGCLLVEHEDGHLHRLTFPDNPGDPDHSLTGVMTASQTTATAECMTATIPPRVRRMRSAGWRCAPIADSWTWTCRRRRAVVYAIRST